MNPKGQFSKLFVSFIFRWVWHFLVSSVSSGYLPLHLRPEPKVRACRRGRHRMVNRERNS
jgi:hypothetical protein